MNTTKKNTEKFVPRIIEFEGSFYMGFIDEKELELEYNKEKEIEKETTVNLLEQEAITYMTKNHMQMGMKYTKCL